MKEYKNSKELLEYLVSKGVYVGNKKYTLNKIKTYSYYSIINTYKDVFKNSENEYNNGTSFNEIFALFEFDMNLRSIFLKYLLEIETIIKSLLAETISSKYGIQNYLVKENFDEMLDENIINKTINDINEEISKQNQKHEAVTHYINKYCFIPPFVLVKILTLGEASRLYSILKQSDRQNISKNFKLSDKILKQIIINMTMVRNICAHNERLFSFHSKFRISFKYIQNEYKKNTVNIYVIMKCMKILLPKEKAKEFEKLIKNEIRKLNNKLTSVKIDNILDIMGFDMYNKVFINI